MIIIQQKTLSNNHYDFNLEKCKSSVFHSKFICFTICVLTERHSMEDYNEKI